MAYSSPVPSACPSIVSGSSVVEPPSQPLTRHSSSFDGRPGVHMLRYWSSQSCHTDTSTGADARFSAPAVDVVDAAAKGPSTCDQDFFGVGAAFPSDVPQTYPCSAPTPGAALVVPPAASTSMQRSVSDASDGSTKSAGSSLERRSKEAFQRVRQNSDRNLIAPKPHENPVGKSPDCVAPSHRDGKVALQKTPYQRPKHPRVYCSQCDEHTEGFRGDHELRRHLNAKHKGVVKKVVCRDPASVGLLSKVKALYPLSECRACTSKKQYGAYYNAAAHLRRTHFKPRAPRGKNKSPADERRGGKGGGDWLPMADIKMWYEEVLVASDVNPLDGALDAADDEAFEPGDELSMELFPELEGGPAAFGVEGTFDVPRSSAAESSPLKETAEGVSSPAGAALHAVPTSHLGFAHMSCPEPSSVEHAFLGEAMATQFSDAELPDFVWDMDGVEPLMS